MRALTAEDVLVAAERLSAEPPASRGPAILALATGIARDDAMALPVGERDDRLLALRIATFGAELTGVAGCPECGTLCETTFDAEQFRTAPRGPDIAQVETGGWSVRARLPNSNDVAEATKEADAELARRALLERCIIERSQEGELPEEVAAALEAEMERLDPRGDVRLALACPNCSESWNAAFDVTTFFLSELRAAGRRLVQEVHVLAREYGWSERDILQLPAARRYAYIEKIIE
jgi:uncharacterized protein (UPF0212 family)